MAKTVKTVAELGKLLAEEHKAIEMLRARREALAEDMTALATEIAQIRGKTAEAPVQAAPAPAKPARKNVARKRGAKKRAPKVRKPPKASKKSVRKDARRQRSPGRG